MENFNLLSRAQMKKVLGGVEDGSGTFCKTDCSCPDGWIPKPGTSFNIRLTCDGDCLVQNGVNISCGPDTYTCSMFNTYFCDPPIIG